MIDDTKSKYRARLPKDLLSHKNKQTCLLGISMNNPNQTGDKLKATIELINKRFSSCVINISGALQRHNLHITGLSKHDAYSQAIAMETQWKHNGWTVISKLSKL
ncbi:hypothetical protein FUAX_02090 [Fulvitalea axinellae]|uniref:Uncharacterized protein n=1 Tax=Fulvitalea axinellae TaxID=1182444 RepID=A0AAU9CQY3_9BACT|nr:hypothetical protein FUAX_02090 [Fulvitalea axinellae]